MTCKNNKQISSDIGKLLKDLKNAKTDKEISEIFSELNKNKFRENLVYDPGSKEFVKRSNNDDDN